MDGRISITRGKETVKDLVKTKEQLQLWRLECPYFFPVVHVCACSASNAAQAQSMTRQRNRKGALHSKTEQLLQSWSKTPQREQFSATADVSTLKKTKLPPRHSFYQKNPLAKTKLLCIEPALRCCAHNSTQTFCVEIESSIHIRENSQLGHVSANQAIIKNSAVSRVEPFWLSSSGKRRIHWNEVTPGIVLADLLNHNGRIFRLQRRRVVSSHLPGWDMCI